MTTRTHRLVWGGAALALSACTTVYDLASGGWVRVAVFGPLTALFGGLLVWVFVEDLTDRWTWVRRAVLWSGLGAVLADALCATWGVLGALVGAVVLATSPPVVGAGRRAFLARALRGVSGPPERLSTRDLLRRWEWTTGEVLSGNTSLSQRLATVEERRRLLDELQLRDPAGFDRWVVEAVPDRAPWRPRSGRPAL